MEFLGSILLGIIGIGVIISHLDLSTLTIKKDYKDSAVLSVAALFCTFLSFAGSFRVTDDDDMSHWQVSPFANIATLIMLLFVVLVVYRSRKHLK